MVQRYCVTLKVKIFIFCFFTQTQKYVEPVFEPFLGVTTQKVRFFLWSCGTRKRFMQAETMQYRFNNQ